MLLIIFNMVKYVHFLKYKNYFITTTTLHRGKYVHHSSGPPFPRTESPLSAPRLCLGAAGAPASVSAAASQAVFILLFCTNLQKWFNLSGRGLPLLNHSISFNTGIVYKCMKEISFKSSFRTHKKLQVHSQLNSLNIPPKLQ